MGRPLSELQAHFYDGYGVPCLAECEVTKLCPAHRPRMRSNRLSIRLARRICVFKDELNDTSGGAPSSLTTFSLLEQAPAVSEPAPPDLIHPILLARVVFDSLFVSPRLPKHLDGHTGLIRQSVVASCPPAFGGAGRSAART